ncbi:MAG: hypothetical protein IPO69_22150 [Saprospiraceae bacterium]|nr:hypothetical protein [Saprospiraceae bacterium]
MKKDILYESREDAIIRGAPEKCSIGKGNSSGLAYIVTRSGYLACWNWNDDKLHRLEDYRAITQQAMLVNFQSLQLESGLLYTTASQIKVVSGEFNKQDKLGHNGSVSACLFTASNQIVSTSEIDKTVRWFSFDGLKPLAQQIRDRWEPITICQHGKTDKVIVGTSSGLIYILPPQGGIDKEQVFEILTEPIVSFFYAGEDCVVAAAKSGKVVRFNLSTKKSEILRNSIMFHEQRKILPAGNSGLYWSVHINDTPKGRQSVVSLELNMNKGEQVLISKDYLFDVAVSSDAKTICVAGEKTLLWRKFQKKWEIICHRNTPISFVTFLGKDDFIGVVLREENWIEIWRITEGLPTVAAVEFDADDKATCLLAMNNRIVAGFLSGNLISLQLYGNS